MTRKPTSSYHEFYHGAMFIVTKKDGSQVRRVMIDDVEQPAVFSNLERAKLYARERIDARRALEDSHAS